MPAELLERAQILSGDARLDMCSRHDRTPLDELTPRRYHHGDIRRHIVTVQHPNGPMPILRTLQTNACANDCFYCPFRAGRSFRREAFSPDELAGLVDRLHRARLIRGLFLSSGVVGHDDYAMDRIIATGEILRRRYEYHGYLHLKIMPRASDAAIESALRLADRVSVNLEAPNPERLARLTGTKDMQSDLMAPLRRVQSIVQTSDRWVSRTSQFVVGAAGETDLEILETVAPLYRRLGLSRVYYMAFHPWPDTPLADTPAESPERQNRLYQADALLRTYGFDLADIHFGADGRLPLDVDPKLAWAREHPEHFPVEVNRAGRRDLLRVPGFGVAASKAILAARRQATLRDEADLVRLGIRTDRALPWITIGGRGAVRQLPLPRPVGRGD